MVGVLSNKISREELKPGDHIYSWRQFYIYAHHGIYAGEGKVIHFTRGASQEIGTVDQKTKETGTRTFLDRINFCSPPSHPKEIGTVDQKTKETGTRTFLDRINFCSPPSHPKDSPCPQCGDQSTLDGVISSCLECFLCGGDLYIFRYSVPLALFFAQARGGTCTLAASDPPEDVLHRANYLLKNGFGDYQIFKNNCEDFAIYCKTGLIVSLGGSGQATSFLAAASAIVSSSPFRFLKTSLPLRFLKTSVPGLVVTTSFPGLVVVSCGSYCYSRYASDIGVRSDVTKVPVEELVARPGVDVPDAAPEKVKKDVAPEKVKKD